VEMELRVRAAKGKDDALIRTSNFSPATYQIEICSWHSFTQSETYDELIRNEVLFVYVGSGQSRANQRRPHDFWKVWRIKVAEVYLLCPSPSALTMNLLYAAKSCLGSGDGTLREVGITNDGLQAVSHFNGLQWCLQRPRRLQ
jgi:hypothetical protein